MDIENNLFEIICKYNIDKHVPGYRAYFRAKELSKILYYEIEKQYETVVLVGYGQTPITWFQRNICENKAAEYVINNLNSDVRLIKQERETRCYLIVSFEYKDELKVKLTEIGLNVKSIYDFFEKNSLYFQNDFYDIYGLLYRDYRTGEITKDFKNFDINQIFFWHRRNFELEQDNKIRKIYLEKIIFDCAYSKDFILLKKYIELYGDEDSSYKKFYIEVGYLLEQISEILEKRNQKDCLMIWLDALEYGEDFDMKFLSEQDAKSLVFDNMYTVTPYTGATFKTLFAKKRVIEEKSFNIIKIGEDDSNFICGLKERGYIFRYYGELDLLKSEYIPTYYYSVYTVMTQIFWDILRDMVLLKENEKCFFVLHEVLHTHIPYISLGLTGKMYSNREEWPGQQEEAEKVLRNQQAWESREYVDKQLEFWNDILPEQIYKIYMSDHGHTFLGRFHTIMKISQKDIRVRHCKSLLSYYDFDKIIIYILEHNDIDDKLFDSEFVIVQDVDYYYKEYILSFIQSNEFTPDGLIGYQGVVTKEDMFISYRHGVEYYQRMRKDNICITDKRLEYLRGKLSKSQIDIYKEKKFKYSRIVWEANQRCTERTKDYEVKKKNVILNMFNNIPLEESIAIRGGGIHTMRLLMLLSDTQRRRISYIIDKDNDCVAGKTGIKILNPENIYETKIDHIIVSSFEFRELWKKELKNQNLDNTVNILDIYDELAKRGVICKRDFYKKDFIKEDFNISG